MDESLFDRACELLPEQLRQKLHVVPEETRCSAEEIRLRIGQPLCIGCKNKEIPVKGLTVTAKDLEEVLDIATHFSRYTAAETMRQGYFTAQGGFRLGICGSAVPEDGEVRYISPVSSLAIRIPRQRFDIADPLLPKLFVDGRFCSTLILSPPGGGKTTLLRDLVRRISQGSEHSPPLRVSLVDERGELAALWRGTPQFDVGAHTDILEGCGKAQGVPLLLRSMNPQVIALDEIAAAEDVEAVKMAVGCGVTMISTCHAFDRCELEKRSIGKSLLDSGAFQRIVTIRREGERRSYHTEEMG